MTFDYKYLPRFVTKKWIEVYHQSEKNYNVNKEIRIKTPMLRSDLCDFSGAYIVVKGPITVTNPDNAKRNKSFAIKNNAPFINCFSKMVYKLKMQKIYNLVHNILELYHVLIQTRLTTRKTKRDI